MDAVEQRELKSAYNETRRQLNELTLLYEMARISTGSLNLDQVLAEILEVLNRFFRSRVMALLLVNETTRQCSIPPMCAGLPGSARDPAASWQDTGAARWAAGSGECLRIQEAQRDQVLSGGPCEVLPEICVPVKRGKRVLGVLDAQGRSEPPFTDEDLRLLKVAGEQLATIIDNVRSDERYRTVVESALDGVIVLGADGTLTYANERMAGLLGCGREELLGRDFRDFLAGKEPQVLFHHTLSAAETEQRPPGCEISVFRKDGGRREVEVSATAILDSQGNRSVVAFLKDITDKKRIEAQLLQAEKLRAVGEMASGVAHDFNNALTIILGNAQLLLLNAQDEESKETLRTIEKAARASSCTVRRLMDFTREEVRREHVNLDINSVIREAVDGAETKYKDEVHARGIPLSIDLNLEDVPPVTGTASELREVVTNLVLNAVEAMPLGGGVKLRTFADQQAVILQVSDTGTGMTDEVKKRIFEPFFTTKPFAHRGLGLSMSYGIVKRLRGRIDVDSRVGQGTTLTLSFPIEREGPISPLPPSPLRKGRRVRVLVIDDEASIRDVLLRILSKAEYQVALATDGEEGLRLFAEKEFDLVLTDLGMPKMSGWEVCHAIKRTKPTTPVGMITGWGVEVDKSRIEACGVDFLVFKPFDSNNILEKVAEAVA
jgi:PAS domain S-box-containing protein